MRVSKLTARLMGYIRSSYHGHGMGQTLLFFFESFAMTLVREMPVNKVSKIIKVDDNKL